MQTHNANMIKCSLEIPMYALCSDPDAVTRNFTTLDAVLGSPDKDHILSPLRYTESKYVLYCLDNMFVVCNQIDWHSNYSGPG